MLATKAYKVKDIYFSHMFIWFLVSAMNCWILLASDILRNLYRFLQYIFWSNSWQLNHRYFCVNLHTHNLYTTEKRFRLLARNPHRPGNCRSLRLFPRLLLYIRRDPAQSVSRLSRLTRKFKPVPGPQDLKEQHRISERVPGLTIIQL